MYEAGREVTTTIFGANRETRRIASLQRTTGGRREESRLYISLWTTVDVILRSVDENAMPTFVIGRPSVTYFSA